MRDLAASRRALAEAERAMDQEIARSMWLAKAADYAVNDAAVLVGGAAVNLHTGSYRPTDIDLCAYLDPEDREAMSEVGFHNTQGDHFSYTFADGETWLLKSTDTQVDGDVAIVVLGEQDSLTVISRDSVVVDRLIQASDNTKITFDDAVRLGVALGDTIDWARVEAEIEVRHSLEPGLGLPRVLRRVRQAVDSSL